MVSIQTAHQIRQDKKNTKASVSDSSYKGIFHKDHLPASFGMFGFIISFALLSLGLGLTPLLNMQRQDEDLGMYSGEVLGDGTMSCSNIIINLNKGGVGVVDPTVFAGDLLSVFVNTTNAPKWSLYYAPKGTTGVAGWTLLSSTKNNPTDFTIPNNLVAGQQYEIRANVFNNDVCDKVCTTSSTVFDTPALSDRCSNLNGFINGVAGGCTSNCVVYFTAGIPTPTPVPTPVLTCPEVTDLTGQATAIADPIAGTGTGFLEYTAYATNTEGKLDKIQLHYAVKKEGQAYAASDWKLIGECGFTPSVITGNCKKSVSGLGVGNYIITANAYAVDGTVTKQCSGNPNCDGGPCGASGMFCNCGSKDSIILNVTAAPVCPFNFTNPLSAPANLSVSGNTVKWSKVTGATSYLLRINDVTTLDNGYAASTCIGLETNDYCGETAGTSEDYTFLANHQYKINVYSKKTNEGCNNLLSTLPASGYGATRLQYFAPVSCPKVTTVNGAASSTVLANGKTGSLEYTAYATNTEGKLNKIQLHYAVKKEEGQTYAASDWKPIGECAFDVPVGSGTCKKSVSGLSVGNYIITANAFADFGLATAAQCSGNPSCNGKTACGAGGMFCDCGLGGGHDSVNLSVSIRPADLLSCSSITSSVPSIVKGGSITFTCLASGSDAHFAQFLVKKSDEIARVVSSSGFLPLSDSKSASWEFDRTAFLLGSYYAECRICKAENENNCTTWGKAGIN